MRWQLHQVKADNQVVKETETTFSPHRRLHPAKGLTGLVPPGHQDLSPLWVENWRMRR